MHHDVFVEKIKKILKSLIFGKMFFSLKSHNNTEMMCKVLFKDFLKMISEKFPKLQRLSLEFQNVPIWLNHICRKFARKKNIKLEISSVLNCFY